MLMFLTIRVGLALILVAAIPYTFDSRDFGRLLV
jgi:hypothetical protein